MKRNTRGKSVRSAAPLSQSKASASERQSSTSDGMWAPTREDGCTALESPSVHDPSSGSVPPSVWPDIQVTGCRLAWQSSNLPCRGLELACAVRAYNHRLGRRKWLYNRSVKPALGHYIATVGDSDLLVASLVICM